ncbi:MAG TPA: hypothetical protein VNI61_02090 [Gemmatimonadales bacterium]|nr:hypothetical protein [Gemmatimonadales bacterium]
MWRVTVEEAGRSGAENMASDFALLEDAERGGPPALRFYRWNPPGLSFGRNEPALSRYDRSRIERLGIAVVRRPTGGGAVWHEDEVTYAVAAPIAAFGGLRAAYRAIHERLAAGLRAAGFAVEIAAERRSPGPGPCFAGAVGGELVAGGRKLAGSAQVRLGGAFLQHGSILLGGSQDAVRAVSRQPVTPARETTLSALAGRAVSFREVVAALVEAWGPDVAPGTPGPPPPRLVARFADPSWIWRR